MAKVQLRQAAIDDLNDIWNYTVKEWSAQHARSLNPYQSDYK
jgi:plasmid stabilization system protein ParE